MESECVVCTASQFGKMERGLRMDGGDGCTRRSLAPLNCTSKNCKNGRFYVLFILLQLKKEKWKIVTDVL